ncbi:MAG: DUF434 domain-containing protein [bacterium]|nr:DUF434 domain-containing protein [bacterium]
MKHDEKYDKGLCGSRSEAIYTNCISQIKQVTTFVGNHYMFSERQRLALTRSSSTDQAIESRVGKLVRL